MRLRTFIAILAACMMLASCKSGGAGQADDPSANIATPPIASATPSNPALSAVPTASPTAAADHTVHKGGHAFPDHALTPGATFAGVTTGQVCTSGWASAHRSVSESLRHQVFAAYGIPYSTHSKYELDHLISLELGGNNTAENLWPETLTDDDSSGPSKDALENHLHALVCHHQLALSTAQHAIATNWLSAWNRYEHVAIRSGSSSGGSSGSGSSGSGSSGGSGGSSNHSGATALCNDGTLSYAAHHQGACSHHGGVKVFYK